MCIINPSLAQSLSKPRHVVDRDTAQKRLRSRSRSLRPNNEHQPGTQRPTHAFLPLFSCSFTHLSAISFVPASAYSSKSSSTPISLASSVFRPPPHHADRLTSAWLDAISRDEYTISWPRRAMRQGARRASHAFAQKQNVLQLRVVMALALSVYGVQGSARSVLLMWLLKGSASPGRKSPFRHVCLR
jgi:hypothetical protein